MHHKPRPVVVFVALSVAAGLLCLIGCRTPEPANSSGGLLANVIPSTPLVSEADGSGFLGSAACRECHPVEFADHQGSTHAHALTPVEDSDVVRYFESRQVVPDEQALADYSFQVHNGHPEFRVRQRGNGRSVESTPKYVFGSGRFAHTFLLERDGKFMESRLSYYPPANRWGWTPGQEPDGTARPYAMGMALPDGPAEECFLCHSTMLVKQAGRLRPDLSILNVGCERCHGPGEQHVAAMKADGSMGKIYGYRGAKADTIMRLCGECHRAPGDASAAEVVGRVDLPRFAASALSLSKCYTESRGQLSCVTCHDPHQTVSTDISRYEQKCQSCHSGGRTSRKQCPVNPKTDCVSCHLPTVHLGSGPLGVPQQVKFYMHWIKPYTAEQLSARQWESP